MGISTSRLGCSRPVDDRVQQDLGAGVVARHQRARPEHVGGEAAHHLREPVDRVGMARAVLGVAVQRQVGEHDPVALGEATDDGLPLPVGEQPGVQQRERRAGADLTIGDAGAVGVVVEAKPHSERLPREHPPIVGASRPRPPILRLQAISQDAPRVAACLARNAPQSSTILRMSVIRTNAAAALLGVSPDTLRSWESRFGYPTPKRTEGGHRQFDLVEIEALRQALVETKDISSATRWRASAARGPRPPRGCAPRSRCSVRRRPTV